MRPSKARFVTACQQALALGAVLAVLAPAAKVVSLDVGGQGPGTPSQPPRPAVPAAVLSPDREPARVPTGEVEPEVREYDLQPREAAEPEETQPPTSRPRNAPSGRPQAADDAPASVLSKPAPVDGFGTVGVTWDADDPVADDAITIQVRTRSDDGWSEWSDLEYHDEHSPDPDSAEARQIRAGTDPLIVGEVADVQVRASAEGAIPHDLTLSVVRPGEPTATAVEGPEIDTADLAQDQQDPAQATGTAEADDGSLELQAGTYTPQPTIYSRAQWGADERLRDPSSLRYHEVHAGFVHHTVNANSYTRDQVPGMIRSIYAYHTQSKGWSDIGYNFLVDRFGRIWEGRYGGVARPVVGAHTLGYNDYAFAMSAIGNFETAQPSSAMLESYGRLMGWKLSLHGVAAASTRQQVGSGTFQAINGHRDAGSTACPGANLYRSLPTIRSLAAAYQRSWSGRQREVDVVSTAYPDVPLRRTSDGAGFVAAWRVVVSHGGSPRGGHAASCERG